MNDCPLTPTELAVVENIARSTVFGEIKEGRLATYLVGRKRLVSPRAAAEWRRARELESARSAASDAASMLAALECEPATAADLERRPLQLSSARSRLRRAAAWLAQLEAEVEQPAAREPEHVVVEARA